MENFKSELLLPAGSLTKLKTALLYGADAVYSGTPDLSLRARSSFPLEELKTGIELVHNKNKKIYLTLNLFSHNKDAEKLSAFTGTIKNLNPDGIIISDPGVFQFVHERIPKLPIHISTQANVSSYLTVNFWKNLGAAQCVLSRETSFKEIKEIKQKCPNIKIEMFIHGAMCISYSGRCLISAFTAARSANRGACAHSCRWKYKMYLEEEQRQGRFFPIEEDDRGTYFFNSKDLCLMPKLNEILDAKIDSLKIEGRNKSEYYVAQTARIYRKAMDDYYQNPQDWKYEKYMAEIETLQNRRYTLGFFNGMPDDTAQDYLDTSSRSSYRNCGYVREVKGSILTLEIRHKISKGDEIELLSPDRFEPYKIKIDDIKISGTKKIVASVSPGQPNMAVDIEVSAKDIKLFPVYTVARKKAD